MHNPAGLSLVSREKWIQFLALFLAISLVWMQIPALLGLDFFASTSLPFDESTLRTKIGFNQLNYNAEFGSQQNSLSVSFSSSAQELGLVADNQNFADIIVISLNYSDLEMIVLAGSQDFGELFVNYESRLGFSAFVPVRRPADQRVNFVRNDQNIHRKVSILVHQDIFREAKNVIESIALNNKPKVLVLLC